MERAQEQIERAHNRYLGEHCHRQDERHDRRLATELDAGERVGGERTDDQAKEGRRSCHYERIANRRDEVALGEERSIMIENQMPWNERWIAKQCGVRCK